MKTIYYIIVVLFMGIFFSCKEDKRFEISGDDTTPPSPPEYLGFKSLVGGARVFYKIPSDEDVLSVNAEYSNSQGKKYTFSASYFVDSLDILGFADTEERSIALFSVDRAGNRSNPISVQVKASESALEQIKQSLKITPAFNSFLVSWNNQLQQPVNIYVDMTFNKSGQQRNVTWVLSSKETNVEETVNDILLSEGELLTVDLRIGDVYGNITPKIEMGEIPVMNDELISKELWNIPNANDSIAGIPMCYGDSYEARARNVINGVVARGKVIDIMHTGSRGRTGRSADGNVPWNFLIDLGDYYELSRIVTNQRHDNNAVAVDPNLRGLYYQGGNVNKYNMYYLDEDTNEWVYISQHTIDVPTGISELEMAKRGGAGDMALMYPESPTFTKRTRWFRYEALTAFSGSPIVLSEITLYGKKANR